LQAEASLLLHRRTLSSPCESRTHRGLEELREFFAAIPSETHFDSIARYSENRNCAKVSLGPLFLHFNVFRLLRLPMPLMRELLEKARISGTMEIEEGLMRDCLPIIYKGDSTAGIKYYNSGGRSLIVERNGSTYKISGVDPYGKLTKRVALSGKNCLSDVADAYKAFSDSGSKKTFRNKPFGVFTYKNIENAQRAFDYLNSTYRFFEVDPPCEIICHSKLDMIQAGEDAYQMLFKLPNAESDLRVWEFTQILRERLKNASRDELKEKEQYIKRIFGRFAAWAGTSAGIMMHAGILPTKGSWAPQNFVISEVEDGYGIFRVDHTSTEYVGKEKAHDEIMGYINGAEAKRNMGYFFGYQFVLFPEAVSIAAHYPELTNNLPVPQGLTPIDKIFTYYISGEPRQPPWDAESIDKGHLATFMMGLQAFGQKDAGTQLKIPAEYFEKVFA